jgi:hypothetical protein
MQNQFDEWGNPVSPQDTHRAYPSGHSDTLVPAVSQAVTRSNNSPKLPSLKGWGRQAIIAGGILGGFWILSSVLSLSSRESSSIPQAIELSPIAPTEEVAPEPPPLSDLTSRRSTAWQEVRQACGVDLINTAQLTDTNVRNARADNWKLWAKGRCDADKNCESPYQWLADQLVERGSRIQRIALADRLPIKAEQVSEYRAAQADLLDIAEALSSGVSARSLSWVPLDKFSDAIDDCSRAASRFDSLTRAAVEESQMFPEGGDPDAF